MQTFKKYFLIYLKGIGMGSADVVPGVSGGTIAFITGIYETLLDAIKKVDLEALSLLKKFQIYILKITQKNILNLKSIHAHYHFI